MFQGFQQRLQKNLNLDFLDNKIAEEQAKQQQQQPVRGPSPAKRTPGSAGTRRGNGPSTRPGRSRQEDARDANLGPASKGPDPEDFVIGEDVSDISRVATPRPARDLAKESADELMKEGGKAESGEGDAVKGKEKADPNTLPQDVRQKLAKLETLTTRYQDLLRNYRTAHAHVATIVPFETTLREHTPLTSISDPGALVEFLTQRNLQNEMVLEELKRMSSERQQATQERDQLKSNLEETKKLAKEAFDKAAALQKAQKPKDDDAFFSYEEEVSRIDTGDEQLEQEVQSQMDRATESSTEHATMHKELVTARENIATAHEKLETLQEEARHKEQQLGEIQSQLSESHSRSKASLDELKAQLAEKESENAELARQAHDAGERAEALVNQIADLEKERDEAKVAEVEEHHNTEIASLRSQLRSAEAERKDAEDTLAALDLLNLAEAKPEAPTVDASDTLSDSSVITTSVPGFTPASSTQDVPSIEGDGLLAPVETNKKGKKKKKSRAKKGQSAPEPPSEPPTARTAVDHDSAVKPLVEDPAHAHEAVQTESSDQPGRPQLRLLMAAYQEKRKSKEAEIERLRQRLEDLTGRQAQIVQEGEIPSSVQVDAVALQTEVADTDAYRTQIKSLEEAMEDLKERLAAGVAAHARDAKLLQAELEKVSHLKGRIEDLETDKEALEESVATVGHDAISHATESRQLRDEKTTWQKALDDLQAERDEYKDKFASAEERVTELALEIADLKKRGTPDEDIETMKEQLEKTRRERESLQAAKEACEKQVEELKSQQTTSSAESEVRYNALSAEHENIRSTSAGLEKDLAAASQLAQTRFRDLTELREHYNKMQPELRQLRDDSAQLKLTKADFEKVSINNRKLEAKEKDLRSEIAEYKSQASAKDGELLSLKEKTKKAEEQNAAMEEAFDKARKDLERSESARNAANEAKDRAQEDVRRFDRELKASRSRVEELERQLKRSSDELGSLRDQVQMKTAQQQSAQSSMDSMQTQTDELVSRMKETKDKNESLEEELQDSQRLLTERSREGETMRRMLKEEEGRADQRVKEMRKELELAKEERQRAEDEANSIGRRKSRELEETRSKLRDAEDQVRRATDARQDAERREREFQTRYEELERQATHKQEEVAEVRSVMKQLRETLDEGERQSRKLDEEMAGLRKTLTEREAQLERLKKSGRTMAEELQKLQAANKTRSRSSMDSIRVKSPESRAGSESTKTSDGKDGVDTAYLKNVLLQFLEQKEKKNQMSLVPVLGMLLQFDRQDEQKWMAAISSAK